MRVKLKSSLVVYFVLIALGVNAQQYSNYKYQRKLGGINNQWHSVVIPNSAFANVSSNFSDLRIIGVKANGDTVEAPYILKVQTDKFGSESVKFNLINQVKNSKGYYYTFELSGGEFVNYINLDFNKSNFDWLVKLEGSQNQEEWFTILERSRVLSIKNSFASYKHTSLTFDKAKFNYFRLFVPTTTNPNLEKVSIKKKTSKKGNYLLPEIFNHQVSETTNGSQTVIFIELKEALPVSYIKLNAVDTIDYYRPITIQYALDSIENNTGWHAIYKTTYSSTLSSLADNEFRFSNTVMKKLKLIIENGDNEPLNYQQANVRGDVHQLVVRFNTKATYYLVYGNKQAHIPNYDINRFETNIPSDLTEVNMENEMATAKNEISEDEAFIKNDLWLWAIMIIVIFILGWFSIKMIKDN